MIHNQDNEIEAGIDEVGRGCLAGRVYAAAVIWPQRMYNEDWHIIKDSKKLSHKKRKIAEEYIKCTAIDYAIGYVDDSGNIIQRRTDPNEMFSPEAMAENERLSNIRSYRDRLDKVNQIIADKQKQSFIDPETGESVRPYGTGFSFRGSLTDPNLYMPFYNIDAYERERDQLQRLLGDSVSRGRENTTPPVMMPQIPVVEPVQQLPQISPEQSNIPVGVQGNTLMRLDQLKPLMNE